MADILMFVLSAAACIVVTLLMSWFICEHEKMNSNDDDESH